MRAQLQVTVTCPHCGHKAVLDAEVVVWNIRPSTPLRDNEPRVTSMRIGGSSADWHQCDGTTRTWAEVNASLASAE